ncbi:methyltransferase [Xylophilus rhododendri]|uniref:Methyltransferase n=1 Tax=Xylophilus rhododendri TaxID=2697032 RepID=A0A857J0F4_9BURK|nr:major capsid protein [Xylophilus rhododendri]QHI96753.1 methyltransferase [Xylophilus rhododendri]
MRNIKQSLVGLLAGASALVASTAQAAAGAAVDVTDVTGTVTAQLPSIAAVGGAVLGVIVAVAAFKWVKRAIS